MREYLRYIQFLVVVSIIRCSLSLPTDDESVKSSRNMAPVMQTLLTDIARELISRSTTNSQVLTLNVSNLLILLLIKGLLWGASYAATTGYPKSRNEDSDFEPFITETEILFLISYLMGHEEKDFQCLHRVACEDPKKAKEYMNAGVVIMNAVKHMGLSSPKEQKYQKLLNELNVAIQFKENGGDCGTRYVCVHESENHI